MANQQMLLSLNVGASISRKLPGLDAENVENFNVVISSDDATIREPRDFVLQPTASITLVFVAPVTKLLMIKTDVPITIKFGVGGDVIPVTSFFAVDGDAPSLGDLVITNTSATDAANVQVTELGV